MNNKVNHQNLLKGLLMLLVILFLMPQGTQAQNYTLGGDYVKFQKFVQPNPEEAAQYVVTTEAEEGETVTASIDPDKIPQGKYFTGVYTSQDVTLTTDWDGATFTMPAKDVTVNAELAAQEDYTIDLTSSTSAVIPMEISTLLSYMEVGGQTCSVYDNEYNWFLDLNVDGINDVEVKSTFDATTQDYIYSIEQLSGDGVYKNTCSFALNVTPLDRYKSLTFKFKEAVPVRTLQADWITLSGDLTYTGQPIKPTVTVKDGNTSVAVTLDYSNNTNAGEATVTVTATAEGYTGSVTKTFTIAPKPVTISGVKAKDKVYDGTTAAEIDAGSATIDGKVGNDEVDIAAGSAAFADANAGEGKTVTFNGFTLAGTSAGNYVLSAQPASATGTIEKKEVTVTTGSATKEYDGTPLTNSEASITGLVPGEKATVIAKGSQTDVGSSPNTYEINWVTAKATNYKVSKEDLGTLTVTPAPEPDPVTENVIETNTETVTNLDGSTTTIVTSKETDSSGKLVKESNTSTTNFLDGSKKVSESKTPETDGKRVYVFEDGTVTRIDHGVSRSNSFFVLNLHRQILDNLINRNLQGSGGSDAQPDILIAQGNESNVLVNKETEIDPQGEVTATSASLTVKQTGDTEGATGKSKPTQIAINAGGDSSSGDPVSAETVTVTFINGVTVLEIIEIEKGTVPEYKGETPTKAEDEMHTYEFAGWDPKIEEVYENTTYYAVFTETLRQYTIKFISEGEVFLTETYAYAEVIEAPSPNPTKAEDDKFTYTFKEWKPSIVTVTGDATYTAVFEATPKTGGDDGGGEGGSENPDAPTSGTFGNFTWEVSKSDANSTVYDVLTISGSGKMKNGSPWSAYKKQIKTVIFESVINEKGVMEGVTSIGNEAFQGFSSLTSVTIPAGVTSIGYMAFNGCSSLKSVTIPAGVTSIGESAFRDCSAMKSLTFAEGSQLQTIGNFAFYGLMSLTSDIILPAGVTSIGNRAFSYANASIDLSNCTLLEAIGSDVVFSQVTGDVTLPSSVTSICQYAFENQYSQPYPGKHVYVTVPDGNVLKVTIAGVTDPEEVTPTNGKADIINCLFDDPSIRIASRALTLEIVEASTGGDNGGGSASGQGQEPSTREKNDRAATTMIVNYEKEKTGSAGGISSVVSSREEVNSTAATAGSLEGEGGAGADPDLVKGDHNTGGTTAGSRAATAEEENDEIEIVSGREYEILHDGFIVLKFYTAGGSITVNSIIIRSPGDANNDGYVNAADIVEMINAKADKASERFNLTNADIDRDGEITQDDIDAVVKLIMEPKDKGDE